jgi:hypothetical protein
LLIAYVSMAYAPDGRLHYAFARSRDVTSATGAQGQDAFVHVASQDGYAPQVRPDP